MKAKDTTRIRFGVRARLLVGMLPLVGVVFALVWIGVTTTARDGLLTLSDRNQSLGSQNLADAVERILTDTYADTLASARLDIVAEAIESGDPKNVAWYADEVVKTKQKYAAFVVVDEYGEVVAANTVDRAGGELASELVGRSVTDEAWAKEAMTAERGTVTPISPQRPKFLDDLLAPGDGVLGFSMPIFDVVDERIGHLAVFCSTAFIGERLERYTSSVGEELESAALLVDAAGAPVVLPTRLAAARPWQRARLSGDDATWHGPAGAVFRITRAAIGGAAGDWNWQVVTLTSARVVESPVQAITNRMQILFALALLLLAVVITAVAWRFLYPIRRLTSAVVAVDRASAFEGLPEPSGDEVGVLTGSLNRMMHTIRDYEVSLEDKVKERTRQLSEAKREVSDILDHMAQGILTVGPGGRVSNEYSAYCEELFGDVPIAGQNLLDLLGVDPQSEPQGHGRMTFWLDTIFGADELQWTFSSEEGLPEVRYRPPRGGSDKIIALSYAPIFRDGVVHRIMIVARDVTEVRDLSEEVRQKDQQVERAAEIAAEITAVGGELFDAFLQEARESLRDAREAAAVLTADADSADRLFRALHTLKGNARIFNIGALQTAAHDTESWLQPLRDAGGPWSTPQATEAQRRLDDLEATVRELERLAERLAPGAADGTAAAVAHTRVSDASIVAVRQAFARLSRELGDAGGAVREKLAALDAAVRILTILPLDVVFQRLRKLVFDASKQLGKRVADLAVSGDALGVEEHVAGRLRDALLHAVSNAMDHGVETPGDRAAAGKSEAATIEVRVAHHGDHVTLEVVDDGRGIDPADVRKQAWAAGTHTAEVLDAASDSEILELLFTPGFSMTEVVTDMSGRGVGMDVIRSTVVDLRGTVNLQSVVGTGTTVRMTLPSELFYNLAEGA